MTSIDSTSLSTLAGAVVTLLAGNGVLTSILNRRQTLAQTAAVTLAAQTAARAQNADTDRKQIDNAEELIRIAMAQLTTLQARSVDSERTYTAQLAALGLQHTDCEKRYIALRDDFLIVNQRLRDVELNQTPQPKGG